MMVTYLQMSLITILNTRWSSFGVGQFITADLGSTQNICSVDIAWYNGNERQYHFVISTSTDGTTFTNKFSGDSSGTTLNSEKYTIPATDARYVRVTVNGNTANNWASITELDIFGIFLVTSHRLHIIMALVLLFQDLVDEFVNEKLTIS